MKRKFRFARRGYYSIFSTIFWVLYGTGMWFIPHGILTLNYIFSILAILGIFMSWSTFHKEEINSHE